MPSLGHPFRVLDSPGRSRASDERLGTFSAPPLRVLALAAGVVALLGAGVGRSAAEEPPADLVNDLESQVTTRAGAPCPDAGAYSLARPDAAAGPTVVGLGTYFQDVASLSDVDQTLDTDVYVIARWRDPRLADPARGDAAAECPVPEGRLWMPAIEPENLRGRQSFYRDRFLVDGRGVVTYARRLWVKLSHPLDFRDFPLDRHVWKVTLWPVLARADEVVFHPLRRVTGMSERLSIQGWSVGEPRAEASTGPRPARAGTYARFDVELTLARNWGYHAWKLGVPLTLIVLMAYGVYFIPATALPQQIGLGTTAMLTLIAYMLTLGSTLPRISYLTRADRFFVGSAILVFLGLVKAVATAAAGQGPRALVLERVNRWGRWVFPLAMLANFALAFLF